MAEYHPDGYILECYARGEVQAEEGRWIEDHIRSGCPICQAAVDALLPQFTEARSPLTLSPPSAPPALRALPAARELPTSTRSQGGPKRRRSLDQTMASLFDSVVDDANDAHGDRSSPGGDVLPPVANSPAPSRGPSLRRRTLQDAGVSEIWDLRPAAAPRKARRSAHTTSRPLTTLALGMPTPNRTASRGKASGRSKTPATRKSALAVTLPPWPEVPARHFRPGADSFAAPRGASTGASAGFSATSAVPNPRGFSGDSENDAWDRIFARLEQRLSLIAVERDGAPRLLAELLRRPAAERAALVRTGRQMHTLALCDLLIEKSFEAGFRDCAEAVALAELAILVADHLDMQHYGSAVAYDMKSRAWAHLGNARRISADLAGAEQALDFAESLAEDGSADPLEEARLLDLRASLLSDQGWFEEAAALLDAVIVIYEEVKDLHRKGRALISKGVNLGMCGMPQRAVELIPEGLSLIDWELDPRLVLMARHNFAWFLNDCGHCDRAKSQLASFRQGYSAFADSWTELGLDWLEARIALRSGHFDEAEQLLERLRRSFLDRGRGYEAAMVMLDLAHLYLDQGRRSEVRRLTEEMLPFLSSEDVHRQAAAALVALQHAASVDLITIALVREVAAYLQRARKNPRLGFLHAA